MLIVAGGDGGDGGVEIGHRTGRFKFCGCSPSPDQRPVAGAVVAEGAAHSIVGADALQQRVNLLDRGLRAAEPQLEHTTHRRRQFSFSSWRSIALRSSFVIVQPCCCSQASRRAT